MAELTVGITGMVGFVGSHLRDRLRQEENVSVPDFEDNFFDDEKQLQEYVSNCDAVVHLAAMNRGDDEEIYNTNVELTNKLVSALKAADKKPHVLFSSSTQIEKDNPYGKSKREGAKILEKWSKAMGSPVSVLVLPNVFGDSGRPFYNSFVATFCYQVTHNEEPTANDAEVSLIYVNELTEYIAERIKQPPSGFELCKVPPTVKVKVSDVRDMLKSFKENYYEKKIVPEFKGDFERNLYNTFITYMDAVDFEQKPVLHSDDRGSLFEVVKQEGAGQVFFSTTKPGITRGNHYHTRKMEKFCVVRGEGLIKMRRIGTDKVIEYKVSGESPSSVEMPIYYTHNITNVGDEEMLTLFWTNEVFDPNDPDTFYEEV